MLGVSQAALHRTDVTEGRRRAADPPWTERLREWIQQSPTFGYRRLWVLLRFRDGVIVNRKAVYRVLKQKRWFVHQRVSTPRPRVQGWTSRASRSNERWAMDVTHIAWGQDGWAHLAAVINCHDRERVRPPESSQGGGAGRRSGLSATIRNVASGGRTGPP